MNIEMLAQIFFAHCGTFTMPTGKTVTPRAWPAHDMFGLCTFPQSEIGRITLLALTVQFAGGVQHEINGTFTFISIAVFQNFFYQLYLFNDMTWCMWLDTGWKYIQGFHCLVVAIEVILYYFHGFQLFQTGLFGDFIFTFVCIVFQITEQAIERDGGTCVA